MVIVIASKTEYAGTVSPAAIGEETTVIEVGPEDDTYLVEGYLDLSAMEAGDEVVVRIYIAVDGTNYRKFLEVFFRDAQAEPVKRIHTLTLLSNMLLKVTLTQTAGTLRSFPYGFVKEVMGTA